MQKILKDSGVKITEIADLLQMTRATFYRWFAGKHPKQMLSYRVVALYVARLDAAVQRKELPLSKDIKQADRRGRIRAILQG